MDVSLWLSALGLGFFGSAHCIAMCGGICSALSFALPAGRPGLRLIILLGYNTGRIASYVFMALALSALAAWFAQHLEPQASRRYLIGLRIIAGVLLIAMGLYLASWWLGIQHLERAGQRLWSVFKPLAQRLTPVHTLPKAVLFGAIWGWLPCGLVYSALALAVSQASPAAAGLTMFAFGLGTLPALLATGLLASRLQAVLNHRRLKQLFAVLLIAFGVWTLVYATGHTDHSGHGDHSTEPNSAPEQPHHHHH
ncbi:sulfite exporter TauE/SafE family protein [Halioxenophilus aromaticivorans]|uniref:Sulfite exporter TauE/SafE family protein n=1 Tax=Halioxenophilus aromaticivorans TaxID=1306992 RepID=A0AAV3TYE9_9ALTE